MQLDVVGPWYCVSCDGAAFGPGAIVWSHAGSGMMHEEAPADFGSEIHGLQFFVNLSATNRMTPPRLLVLDGADVPEWLSPDGDRVRIVVGAYQGKWSPLRPIEAFTLLDAHVVRQISFDLLQGNDALIYVSDGSVSVSATGSEKQLDATQAVAFRW